MRALNVYAQSKGSVTRAYYAALETRGPIGVVAMNLFRAQKCSARAKKYRGGIRGVGSFKSLAYDRKGWSLQQLCQVLVQDAARLGIRFGWARDEAQTFNRDVLYVDLPQGQVSFHSHERYEGPDYPEPWDGQRKSEERILMFCDAVSNFGDATPFFLNKHLVKITFRRRTIGRKRKSE